MEDKKNYEIFPGKTLSDLFKDIYKNSTKTGEQVGGLVDELKKLVTGLDAAVTVVPLIREYLDVKVKSDEHLVKLSDTIQRMLRNDKTTGETGLEITEEEKKKLLEDVPTYEEIRNKNKEKIDKLGEQVEKIKKEFGEIEEEDNGSDEG